MVKSARRHHHFHKTLQVKRPAKAKAVDRLIYLAAIVEPLFSLPQAILVYRQHSASDISILAWVGFEAMTLIWIWYAIVHKERTILVYQALYFVIDGSILVAAIAYGGQLV